MNAVRIRTTLTSDTPHLPELRPFVGRPVEIIVLADDPAGVRPPTASWEEVTEALRQLREAGTYDFDALRDQNECDLKHAGDHLR
ncbi:MAG: hypothetical protein K2P78_01670 [Gemmataceae bacterium]|nr:hypothetical protein [Gemmataceae bacterium]